MSGARVSFRRLVFPGLMAVLVATGCVTEVRRVASDRPASVEGRITLEGPIPRSWQVAEGAEPWPGALQAPPEGWTGTPPREIEVTPSGGARGVAVWLERAGRRDSEGAGPEPDEVASSETVDFRLEGSCFWPMAAVLPVGGRLRFENRDLRSHHVRFLADDAPPDVIVEAGGTAEVRMERAGRYRLTCNDHAFMRADLIVSPTSWWAVSDADGRFLIEDVPGGHYVVRFAHHRLTEADPAPVVILGGGGRAYVELRAKRGHWSRTGDPKSR